MLNERLFEGKSPISDFYAIPHSCETFCTLIMLSCLRLRTHLLGPFRDVNLGTGKELTSVNFSHYFNEENIGISAWHLCDSESSSVFFR